MSTTPNDVLMRACKLQMETAAGMIEALTQGARQMMQAHATGNPQELWRLQNEWATATLQKTTAYWQECWEIALAAQSSIAQQLSQQMHLPGVQGPANATGQVALLDMMDGAYKRWLESTRQFHSAPTVSTPQSRQAAKP